MRLDVKRKFNAYTLVELLSVILVLGAGLTGITSLNSVMMDSNFNAVKKSLAIDVADQFLSFNSVKLKQDWSWTAAFPDSKPIGDDSKIDSGLLQGAWSLNNVVENDHFRLRFLTLDANEEFDPNKHQFGVFRFERLHDNNVDFVVSIRSWKEMYDLGDGAYEGNFFVEVSYPAEVVYDKRQKELFTFEAFKQPEIPLDPNPPSSP